MDTSLKVGTTKRKPHEEHTETMEAPDSLRSFGLPEDSLQTPNADPLDMLDFGSGVSAPGEMPRPAGLDASIVDDW